MEEFDYDLVKYQNKLSQDDKNDALDKTYECTDYRLSGCCNALIYDEQDICSECKEHCDTMCQDCENKFKCANPNKNFV
jgi:hypothetical protein